MNTIAVPLPASKARPRRRLPGNAKVWTGLAILLCMAIVALVPGLFGAGDPYHLDVQARLAPVSAEHLLGTDSLGRDLYTIILYGARISLLVGFSCAILAGLVGAAIGLLSASVRWLDAIIMRVLDGFMSIPGIMFAIILVAVTGGSVKNVIIAVSIIEVPPVTRLVRSVALSLRERPFVEAAIAAGSTMPRIVLFYFVPGILAPLLVQATFIWSTAMLIEASLSFIGVGAPPSTPSWGNIMAASKALWQVKPMLVFMPALMLFLTVMAVNLLGDGLRQWLDPRRQRRAG